MEDEVLSAKSPLFGRRTAQLNLQPFGYEEAALFVPDYTPQEKLIAVRIVNREVPILNKNKRYVRYVLSDGVFAFWYRFVLRGITAIGLGFGRDYFETQVKQYLNDFMAEEFERVCRRYALKLSMTGRIATGIFEVGKWMGNDNVQKETADIDVVGLNTTDHLAVIGECKFRNEPMDVKSVAKCLDRARLLPGYHVAEYLMFSKGGYKEGVKEAFADQPVHFFELEDLYG